MSRYTELAVGTKVVIAVLLLASCASNRKTPIAKTPVVEIPIAETPVEADMTSEAAEASATWFPAAPTLANAGAAECRILAPINLGSRTVSSSFTKLGFGPDHGIATILSQEGEVQIQRIGLDGHKIGAAVAGKVDADTSPKYVFWMDGVFLILSQKRVLPNYEVSWFGMVFDENETLQQPTTIPFDGMDIIAVQKIGSHRLGVIAAPVTGQPGDTRWYTVELSANGSLVSSPGAAIDAALWKSAKLGDSRGWILAQDGQRGPMGVFGGVQKAAADAEVLDDEDTVNVKVENGAVPPARRGGVIRHALGQPLLVRMHQGQALGRKLLTSWHGTTVGAHSMNIQRNIFWSGTHFLYPYHDRMGINILPIDCK